MRFLTFFISTWTGRSFALLMALYLPPDKAKTMPASPLSIALLRQKTRQLPDHFPDSRA